MTLAEIFNKIETLQLNAVDDSLSMEIFDGTMQSDLGKLYIAKWIKELVDTIVELKSLNKIDKNISYKVDMYPQHNNI